MNQEVVSELLHREAEECEAGAIQFLDLPIPDRSVHQTRMIFCEALMGWLKWCDKDDSSVSIAAPVSGAPPCSLCRCWYAFTGTPKKRSMRLSWHTAPDSRHPQRTRMVARHPDTTAKALGMSVSIPKAAEPINRHAGSNALPLPDEALPVQGQI